MIASDVWSNVVNDMRILEEKEGKEGWEERWLVLPLSSGLVGWGFLSALGTSGLRAVKRNMIHRSHDVCLTKSTDNDKEHTYFHTHSRPTKTNALPTHTEKTWWLFQILRDRNLQYLPTRKNHFFISHFCTSCCAVKLHGLICDFVCVWQTLIKKTISLTGS